MEKKTTLTIGQNNLIRECVSISTGTDGVGVLPVLEITAFLCGSHVGHDCKLGDNIIIKNLL